MNLQTEHEEIATLIREKIGPLRTVKYLTAGRNGVVSIDVHAGDDRYFVKGVRHDGPQYRTWLNEMSVNRIVSHISPKLKWTTAGKNWSLLGLDYIDGRHVNYAPGTDDTVPVVFLLLDLQDMACPDINIDTAEKRWYRYTDTPELFAGDNLVHTDWSPGNVRIVNGVGKLTNWSNPVRGADWLDPACCAVRLIAAGHLPHSAEKWMSAIRSWKSAPRKSLDEFARVQAAVWEEAAHESPEAWVQNVARAAQHWSQYRTGVPPYEQQ